MPWGWPFGTMIRNPQQPIHGGKRGKSKRRVANKRARTTRKKTR